MSVNLCTITGTVVKGDGTPFANGTLTFSSVIVQTVQGAFVPITSVNATTDVNGNINGGSGISLIQGLFVQVSLTLNGNNYSQFTAMVPAVSSASFGSFASGILQPPTTITTGTWTPTFGGLSTNPSPSYASQIGRFATWSTGGQTLVWLSYFVSWNSYTGGSGQALILGNPNITASNFTEGYIGNMNGSTSTTLGIQMPPGTNQLGVVTTATGNVVNVSNFNPAAFGQMLGFIVYSNY